MFEKNLSLLPLFDTYGALLTEAQRQMFELYYGDDLSLGEIAEEMGISRQGVRDSLKRCEEALTLYERKLGFTKKLSDIDKASSLIAGIDDDRARRAYAVLTAVTSADE
ncbi:MAG: YlxM family DNA-binding protein [Clostridia bacterium]|nr:YlxM family DNA-binding protein [Clostridia bacterium]